MAGLARAFASTDITGAQYGQSLKLTDPGALRTLADWARW